MDLNIHVFNSVLLWIHFFIAQPKAFLLVDPTIERGREFWLCYRSLKYPMGEPRTSLGLPQHFFRNWGKHMIKHRIFPLSIPILDDVWSAVVAVTSASKSEVPWRRCSCPPRWNASRCLVNPTSSLPCEQCDLNPCWLMIIMGMWPLFIGIQSIKISVYRWIITDKWCLVDDWLGDYTTQ